MAEINIINLSQRFGDLNAVDNINLRIFDGEFFAILGPSGCGKTTILRAIAGLNDITTGQIYLDGQDITNLHPRDRGVAMVFQTFALYPHLTVLGNLMFGQRMRGKSKKEAKKKSEEVADVLKIKQFLSRKPKQLSGGESQRVAIGRAILQSPKIFLLDEPLSNLDAKMRVDLRSELLEIHKKIKATTIYVTHDQVEALTLADRIAIMKDGSILQIGTPKEIFDFPDNTFVAEFIGNPGMNIIDSSLIPTRDILPLLETMLNKTSIDCENIQIGIRPTDFDITTHNQDAVRLEGQVIFIENLGHEYIIYVQVKTKRLLVQQKLNKIPELGTKIILFVNRQKIHIFESKTGKRLPILVNPD